MRTTWTSILGWGFASKSDTLQQTEKGTNAKLLAAAATPLLTQSVSFGTSSCS